jgi:hypothetical protein
MVDLTQFDIMSSASSGFVSGNDIASFTVIEAPDDRYLPGYSAVQVDKDSVSVGPRLKDLNLPFSLYGLPIPITFGVRRLHGNLIWCKPLRENIKKTKSTGKGGVTARSVEYEYYGTFAYSFGYPGNTSPGARDILSIWADGSLVYDRRGTGQTKIQGLNVKFYEGTETQMPDPTIEAQEGVGLVPGYRGLMYLVIDSLPLADFGNRPPSISVEIGDATAPSYSITNIYPAVDPLGSRSQNSLAVDHDMNQVYTTRTSDPYYTIRTYDFTTSSVISMVQANVDGAGWLNNSGSRISSNLASKKGLLFAAYQDVSYIPSLGVLLGQTNVSTLGLAPVVLVDPISGTVTNWMGSVGGTTTLEYPSGSAVPSDVLPYNQGKIPHVEKWASQIVFNQYAVDTYMIGVTTYGDTLMLKVDGLTGILDMNYFDLNDHEQVVPGGVYSGYSDFYAVNGSVIYRYRVTVGAARLSLTSTTSSSHGVTRTTWRTMPSGINNLMYYGVEDALLVLLDNGAIYKYDATANTETYNVTGTVPPTVGHSKMSWMGDISNGFFAWISSANIVQELDIAFGTVATFSDPSGHFFSSEEIYDSKTRSFTAIANAGAGGVGTGQANSLLDSVSRIYYDRLADERMPLADFITGMALYAGYAPSEIEVSASIDDLIDGAMITQISSYRRIMDVLATVYRIDQIESGGKIKFVRKAVSYSADDFTIPEGGTLLTNANQPDESSVQIRREEEAEIPQRVLLRYIDKSLSYNWSMQMATRSQFIETNSSTDQITYELPIIMTASEAKTLANRALYAAWTSRMSFAFRLPPNYLKVEPSDVGSLTSGGIVYKIRAVEVTYNNDFSIGLRGQSFLSDEPVTIVGDAGTGYDQSIPSIFGSTMYIIDTPIVREIDDLNFSGQYPLYLHISPLAPTSSWAGGSAYFSNNLVDYSEVAANTQEGVTCIAVNALVTPDTVLSTDLVNTLTVVVKAGDSTNLVSVTEAELNEGLNLAAYGQQGRFELIQFQTVTDNGDGSYTLSVIRRARRGTDYAVDFHRPGDLLILMDTLSTDVTAFSHSQTEITVSYKGVSFGQNPTQVIPKRQKLAGYAALPWVPTIPTINRSRTALTGDLTIAWNRRDRVSGGILDGAENAPLRDTEENSYKVTIWRWPHYDNWMFSGTWAPGADDLTNNTVEYLVTDATTLTLTAAQIRTAQLYEFSAPDNLADIGSAFSQVAGSYIAANATINEPIVALGYTSFMAFKYLDIMIQQKTNVPNSTGYGPGRMVRVNIQDT